MKGKVLVTGGLGYIGSHTTVELINAGYEVVIVDNLSNSNIEVLNGIHKITNVTPEFVLVDCCDYEQLYLNVFSVHKFDCIIHFAAYKAVGESVNEPLKYYYNNLLSFMNILKLSIDTECYNILFSSSATVYGEADELPVTENTKRKLATSPYGNTKQICEDILRDVCNANSIHGISLRYFNPIGAHPSGYIGENPKGKPNNLVPFITQTAVGKYDRLEVFGDDYDTPDGSTLRDYIDVVDLASAHVSAMDRMLQNKMHTNYEVFNIGTGKPVSVFELIREFEKANNIKLNYKVANRREGDVPIIYADTTLANNELNWKAERPLSETLKCAYQWEMVNQHTE